MNFFSIFGHSIAFVTGLMAALLGWGIAQLSIPIFLSVFLYLILGASVGFLISAAIMLVRIGREEDLSR